MYHKIETFANQILKDAKIEKNLPRNGEEIMLEFALTDTNRTHPWQEKKFSDIDGYFIKKISEMVI